MVISNCMYSVFSTISSLPPIMFLLCNIPVAISGGTGALFMAASCYIVDVTDCKSRAFWLGVLYASVNLGSMVGSILSPILYATIPVIGVYVFNTKLQFPEMYIGIAAAALGIFEKIGLAYSVHRWQFYVMKSVGYNLYISQSLVRSQLSKSIPPEDLCKIFAFLGMIENFGVLLYLPIYTAVYVSTIHDFANCFFFLSAILNTFVFVLFG